MRAVLDPNVLVSAVISPAGPPRGILAAWTQERFDLVVSPGLLEELRDVLARPKFRRWISADVAAQYVDGLADAALVVDDPPVQPGLSPDPDDDYLVTLARLAGADYLVSGDRHSAARRRPSSSTGPRSPASARTPSSSTPRARCVRPRRATSWRSPPASSTWRGAWC